ncbi:hypothetical protein [Janthinobacterium sp. RT4P48]|uniref:hypothetical protein n=1 Tax=Janthinobacterium sp. RT4P48 TaxID=3424188 RepID=UPI003F246231
MGKYRHHQLFPKLKHIQAFRFPHVCLHCRKSFKYPATTEERCCPQCRAALVMLSRKFSAPPARDAAQWAKIRFLIGHGFRFYSVYEPACGGMKAVRYPATLAEARDFVQKHAAQKVKQAAATAPGCSPDSQAAGNCTPGARARDA